MSRPIDHQKADAEQAQDALREAIDNSRELVRQSRVLLELSECEGAVPANDNGRNTPD